MTVYGKGAHFEVSDSGATTRDISANVTNTSVQRSSDVLDVTTYGQTGHKYGNSLTDGQITVEGFWDKTADTGSDTVLKGLIGFGETPFVWGPEGSSTGKAKVSGNVVLQDYTTSAPIAGIVTFTATFKISGAVTDGTFA